MSKDKRIIEIPIDNPVFEEALNKTADAVELLGKPCLSLTSDQKHTLHRAFSGWNQLGSELAGAVAHMELNGGELAIQAQHDLRLAVQKAGDDFWEERWDNCGG